MVGAGCSAEGTTRGGSAGARRWGTLVLALCPMWAGCAELNGLNPSYRRQWAEDERVMPSFHTHWQRIRALEGQVRWMSDEEQRRTAQELTRLIREDPNVVLKLAAIRSLAAFPADVAQPGVLAAATDREPEVRAAACAALRKIGTDMCFDVLASLAEQDENLDVRLAATRALAGVNRPSALQALATVLDDRDPALQYEAMTALAQTSGRKYGYDVALWKSYLRGENPPQPPAPSLVDQIRDTLFR